MRSTDRGIKRALCALLAALMLLLSAVPAMAVGQSSTLAKSGAAYKVTASGLNVRAGAGMSYLVIAKAKRGSEVTYLSDKNGWWYVRLSDGTRGYVDKQYLTPVSATSTGNYTVTASKLRIRKYPTTDSKTLGTIERGSVVNLTKLNGDWGYVSVNGISGWVAVKYLTKGGSVKAAANVKSGSMYTVIASTLNVRKTASGSSGRKDTISRGTSVKVSSVSGGWAYVVYTKNGKIKEGWVSTQYLG